MKKLLLVLPLLLFSCSTESINQIDIREDRMPDDLKGLKLYVISRGGDNVYIPILNNPLHDKKNISVVNKSNNEIIIVDEMLSKNDSIITFKIKKK